MEKKTWNKNKKMRRWLRRTKPRLMKMTLKNKEVRGWLSNHKWQLE